VSSLKALWGNCAVLSHRSLFRTQLSVAKTAILLEKKNSFVLETDTTALVSHTWSVFLDLYATDAGFIFESSPCSGAHGEGLFVVRIDSSAYYYDHGNVDVTICF